MRSHTPQRACYVGRQLRTRGSAGRSEALEATAFLPVGDGGAEGVLLDPRQAGSAGDDVVTETPPSSTSAKVAAMPLSRAGTRGRSEPVCRRRMPLERQLVVDAEPGGDGGRRPGTG